MSSEFKKKINEDVHFPNRKFDSGKMEANGSGELDNVNYAEMGPPFFMDMDKQARDLFNTGYNFGLLSLNIITKSPNNVKFITTCIENLSLRNLFGSLEAQYELRDSLVLTEKWNTDCVVAVELSSKHRPVRDFKITLAGLASPRSGDKVGTLEAEWTNRLCALNSKLEMGRKFSLLTSSAVFKYRGLLGGVLTKFDAFTSKLNDVNLAAGYATNDFILHASFNNGSECGGSIFHRVTPRIDAGVHFVYSATKKADIIFGVAGRYQVNDNVCFRGKINNLSQLGLGCEKRFRDCILLSFSVLSDVKYFSEILEGKYKLGLSIHFES